MGSFCSCCDDGAEEYGRHGRDDERRPLRAAAVREENAALLEPIMEKREAALLKGGSGQEAYGFAQAMIDLGRNARDLLDSLEDRDRLLTDAIKYLDFAIQAEAAFGGNKMRERMYLARAELLWMLNKVEDSFKEYMGCLKEDINERVIESWFPKLRELGRENEIDKICKEVYRRAKDKTQQELLLRAFYQYTTLSTKAAYEWADPLEVDQFVEHEKSQGRGRDSLRGRSSALDSHEPESSPADGGERVYEGEEEQKNVKAAEEERKRRERLSAPPPPLLVPPSPGGTYS